MDENATRSLMELLLEGTDVGWLKWSKTSDESVYQVSLSHHSIVLAQPSSESPVQLRVYNEDAHLLATLDDNEILPNLFSVVKGRILDVDGAIHNVVESLIEKRRLWTKESASAALMSRVTAILLDSPEVLQIMDSLRRNRVVKELNDREVLVIVAEVITLMKDRLIGKS